MDTAIDTPVQAHSRPLLNWQVMIPPLALTIVVIALMAPVFTAEQTEMWDQRYYAEYAQDWYASGYPSPIIPHLGYPLLLMLTYRVTQLDIHQLAIAINVAALVASAWISYGFLLAAFKTRTNRARWIAAGLSLALIVVAPITFLTWSLNNFYFGYVVPNVYHNPTSILLKPLALAQAILVLRALTRSRASTGELLVTFLVSVAAVMAKPSFALCILPVAILLLLWRLARRQPVDWLTLGVAVAIPTAVMLGAQDSIMGTTRGSVYFAPFESFTMNDDHNAMYLFVFKQALSMLFPLLVVAMFWRKALRSTTLQLAWLAFIAGLGQAYLFNEPLHPRAGNFWWGAQISLYVLFVFSARFALEQIDWRSLKTRFVTLVNVAPAAVALGLHVICGLAWWYIHLQGLWIPAFMTRQWW